MATKIILQCIDKTLEPVSLPKLTSGGKKDIRLEVQFDESWDGYVGKTATFYRDKALVHHATMASNSCEVPWSVIFDPGVVYVGVFGVNNNVLKTTEVLPLDICQGAIPGPSSAEPIPDIYQQLLNAYGKMHAEQSVANARIDQLVAGGTVDNAELLDVRVAGDGSTYASAGAAVRANHADLKGLVGAGLVQPYNLLDPFTCKKDTGLSSAAGAETTAVGQWCTDFFPVEAGMIAYSTKDIYKLIGYDANMAYVSNYSYGATVPAGVAYMRAVYQDTVVPFEDRFGVTISHFGVFPRPIFAFKGTDLSEAFVLRQIERSTFTADDFVVAGLAQKTNATTGKDFLILTIGGSRLVTPYPVRLLKGATLNAGKHLMRVYQCDKERYWLAGNGANVSTFMADEDMYAIISIAHETNVPLTNALIADILADLSIVRLDAAANAPESFGEYLFDIPLSGVTYMSDHTFINDQLYVLNASSDDHNEYATVNVYDVDHDIGSAVLVRTFKHNLGHGNSIDYCAGNGCLILGNGSGDSSLPGEIYILPDAANRETWEYDDCLKINVAHEGWGIKTNVVWGEHNNGEYNIAYVITNNNANVRKIMLTKRNGLFTGSYTVLGEWATEPIDVNQGTVYRDGKLYIALGHSQVWALVYTLNPDGTITVKQLKDVFYDSKGATLSAPFAEGITIENGFTYFGVSDGRVLVYGTKAPKSTLDIEGEVPDDVMLRRHYDTNNSGVVDDAEKLGGKAPGYYAAADHVHTAGEVEGYDGLIVKKGNPVQAELKGGRGITAVATLTPQQQGSGDPSPDNIRPFIGYDKLGLNHVGKNLCNISPFLSAWATENADMLSLLNTLAPGTYTVSVVFEMQNPERASATDKCGLFLYPYGERVFVEWGSVSVGTTRRVACTFNVTADNAGKFTAAYFYGCGDDGIGYTGYATVKDVQLEINTTATHFAPYQSKLHTVQIGQTICGGRFDWLAGKLTDGIPPIEFDGDEVVSTDGGGIFATSAFGEASAAYGEMWCSHYAVVHDYDTFMSTDMSVCVWASGQIRIHDSRFNSVSEINAEIAAQSAAGTPVQIAYKLATPIEIQLTGAGVIEALEGVNTVYGDGDLEVTLNHDRLLTLMWPKLMAE